MSYYNSSSSHYFGHSFNTGSSSSSYYNDMYRSYSNLRTLPSSYSQPFYLSTCPYVSSSSYKRLSPPSSPSLLKPYSKSKSPTLSRSPTVHIIPTVTITEKVTSNTTEVYEQATPLPIIDQSIKQSNETQQLNNDSANNDVNATAISSIRLNCTDDLTTQVDYYLNEVIKFFCLKI